jgi:hypothetical protein
LCCLAKTSKVSGKIGEDALINTKYPLTRVSRGFHATHWVAKASVVSEIPGIPRFGVKGSFMGLALYRREAPHALSNGTLLNVRRG